VPNDRFSPVIDIAPQIRDFPAPLFPMNPSISPFLQAKLLFEQLSTILGEADKLSRNLSVG